MSDSLVTYTYGLIGRIKLVDPGRAAQLRREYSAALRAGGEAETRKGMEIERIHGSYLRELYRRGLVK